MTEVEERNINKELYAALMKGDTNKVIHLCRSIPKGPLHALTIHHDTVLHMATYSKQSYLVMELLNLVPENYGDELTYQNDVGNTMLHEAATSDRIIMGAIEMLRRSPRLISMTNKRGETPIFRAARYGKNQMYHFLDVEMHKVIQSEADLRIFHFREDNTSILHIPILMEHYDLALQIAKKYIYLIDKKDGDDMTALQLLACNPSAFYGGEREGGSLKKFIYSCITTKRNATKEGCTCKVPLWTQMKGQKLIYESVIELARFLIKEDTTWEATESALDQSKPMTHRYRKTSMGPRDQGKEQKTSDVAETPLFLATKSGCTEIVEGILEMYPQAVEHIDDEGRNILHVAIKYRQVQIFDIVEKMGTPMRRLIRKIDNSGNSILHMVGIKKTTEVGDEDMRSPALILQEDLLLFEVNAPIIRLS